MSKRSDPDLLQDMLQAMQRIEAYIDQMSYDSFMQDTRTQDAVLRNLEIIGEATKQLSPATRTRYAHLPWKSIAGMRDRLIHNYFGVNLDIVWQVISNELPGMHPSIVSIVKQI